MAMTIQPELHNRLAHEIINVIIRRPLEAGGDAGDVFYLLETIIMGVFLAGVKLGGDERILDEIIAHVKQRLAEARLAGIEIEGSG